MRISVDLEPEVAQQTLEALDTLVALASVPGEGRPELSDLRRGARTLRAALLEALPLEAAFGDAGSCGTALVRAWDEGEGRTAFAASALEYRADPRTLLGVLAALESATRPYAAPEDFDAASAREYLVGVRDAWRPHAHRLRHAAARWDEHVRQLATDRGF